MKVRPRSRPDAAGVGGGLLHRLAVQHHLRPVLRVFITFTVGVLTGITMVAGMPSRRA